MIQEHQDAQGGAQGNKGVCPFFLVLPHEEESDKVREKEKGHSGLIYELFNFDLRFLPDTGCRMPDAGSCYSKSKQLFLMLLSYLPT